MTSKPNLALCAISILLVLLLGTTTAHDLYVLHPHSLARSFNINGKTNKGLVKSSLGGFGHYDLHGVFQGRVHYPLSN